MRCVVIIHRIMKEDYMIGHNVDEEIEHLLEETDLAFHAYISSGENPNTDFAGYACQALPYFRKAMANPTLSADELAAALRRLSRQQTEGPSGISGQTYIAACLANQYYVPRKTKAA